MTKYLITPSLINSFQYYIKDEWKSPEDSRADFLRTLSRERFQPNEAMQKGIDFENKIEAWCNGSDNNDLIVNEIGDIVKGGLWQESCKKDLTIGGNNFILYGRCDVVKGDTIYDIKYTKRYDVGKFQDSIQHLIYLYCLDLPNFSYLVSDGKDFWREDYSNNNEVENVIKSKISDFLDYLDNDDEAKSLFKNNWKNKY